MLQAQVNAKAVPHKVKDKDKEIGLMAKN